MRGAAGRLAVSLFGSNAPRITTCWSQQRLRCTSSCRNYVVEQRSTGSGKSYHHLQLPDVG